MKIKIVGFLIMTLLIGAAFPTVGIMHRNLNQENNPDCYFQENEFPTAGNGVVFDQQLDENGGGYTVIGVWGSHYEMGYAQAELLGDLPLEGLQEIKDSLGEDYDFARQVAADTVWMPPGVEDEIRGMVDYLTATHPFADIDEIDIKVVQLISEFWYQGCRSHTCWGRYVSDPVKTLSTLRLDWPVPISALYHHVLCAHNPDDGSPKWATLGWPGVVAVTTGVNEFGTAIRLHDYKSFDIDMTLGRISRGIACRYALTYATSSDVSTHLADVYDELQNYEVMNGGFLNYYAPEGHGGVMTSHPYQSGPDFYNLRIPKSSWHHGEAMITTNSWTDGTYTPSDEDFGADAYYNDETPKTLQSHWDLLNTDSHGFRNLHLFSVAYRGPNDMTIWAQGKTSNSERTPRLEYEWDELFSRPPTTPDITGKTKGEAGEQYEYSFISTDPDGDDISYYINWEDGAITQWTPYQPSGTPYSEKHTWSQGMYIIRAKSRDINGLESDITPYIVQMPKNKFYSKPSLLLLSKTFVNHFPLLEKILNQILKI